MLNKVDKMMYEMAMLNINEKIKEQEAVLAAVNDPALKRLVDDRITSLEVELSLYRRILKDNKED